MIKAVNSPSDLYLGWSAFVGGCCWVFLGRTRKLFSGKHLYRFLLVDCSARISKTELYNEEAVWYVLSCLH